MTASGEKIKSGNAYSVVGCDECGRCLSMDGLLTDVRKPLISAGAVADKGHDAYLCGDESYIMWKSSPAHPEIRDAVKGSLQKHAYKNTTQLYKESSVYNFYVKVESSPEYQRDSMEPKGSPLCPNEQINYRLGRSP